MDPTARPGPPSSPEPPIRRARTRPTLGELMLLIAGVGLGLAIASPILREEGRWNPDRLLVLGAAVLGGISLVGVPMLLWGRWRGDRRRFGPGGLLWFAHGTAAWLLWPPIVVGRASRRAGRNPPIVEPGAAEICFYYGTPLMAVYVTAALLAGGRLRVRGRRGRRRPAALPWRERFGLLLGLGWAVLGLYVLSMVYRGKFN